MGYDILMHVTVCNSAAGWWCMLDVVLRGIVGLVIVVFIVDVLVRSLLLALTLLIAPLGEGFTLRFGG